MLKQSENESWRITHLAHIGSNIWSLFALHIHIKSWTKVKLGKVQVGSNIARNHSSRPWEVIYGHYLKMTFRVITFHILGQNWFHNKEATWCNKFGQHLIMGKLAKPDLSDLENDILNNSMKSISWQLINIIPKKLYTRNKEKLSDRFRENWQKVAKTAKFDLYQTFWTLKNDL